MIQPVGYFKIWRELFTKPIWLKSTPEQKSILVTLIAMANFADREWEWKGEKFKAKRGQFVTSLESIRDSSGVGVSIQNVRSALQRFEKKFDFLTNESTKMGRLITIVNWELYQSDDDKLTDKLTNAQQRGNKDLTTREEGKKDKKERSKDIIFSPESWEYKFASGLQKMILKNNPTAKTPDDLQKWAKGFDMILRIDNRDIDEIPEVLMFSQQDKFWQKNILSPDSFRKHYDKLKMLWEEWSNKS
jgi:hypothetical protein